MTRRRRRLAMPPVVKIVTTRFRGVKAMLMVCVRRPLVGAGLALVFALAPGSLSAAPAAGETKDKPATPAEKIKKQLDQTITLDIAEQPLNLALNQIREQTKINFVVDKLTIQQMGMDPDQMPVNAKLKEVKVRTALRSVLGPYNLGYAIIGDTVLISTDDMAMIRQMRQRVSIDLDKVDLAAALKQLSRDTAANVLLDPRAAKDAKTEVSLQMEDVPLETAVKLMAEMASLKPVKVGNVLFVTTKANAAEMRNDPDLNGAGGNPAMPGMPGYVVPPNGPGGFPVPGGVPPGIGVTPAGAVPAGVEVPNVEKTTEPEKKPVEDKEKPDKGDPKPDVIKKDKEG